MRKMMAAFLAVVLMCCFSATAFAAYTEVIQTADAPKTASLYVKCDSETEYTTWRNCIFKSTQYGSVDNRCIFVRHYVNGGSSEYTNHFRACEVNGSDLTTRGSKWCTVAQNVPIQGNNIRLQKFYTVSARGNTKHHEYDGISNITLNANLFVNFSKMPE